MSLLSISVVEVTPRLHPHPEKLPVQGYVALSAGLEPATSCFVGRCSIQLNYESIAYRIEEYGTQQTTAMRDDFP